MRLRLLILGAVIGLVAGLAWPFVTSARAQLVRTTPPEQLRFRLVGTEPIASADGTNSRTGWYVSVFRHAEERAVLRGVLERLRHVHDRSDCLSVVCGATERLTAVVDFDAIDLDHSCAFDNPPRT